MEIFFQISILNYTNLIPQFFLYANRANLSLYTNRLTSEWRVIIILIILLAYNEVNRFSRNKLIRCHILHKYQEMELVLLCQKRFSSHLNQNIS